VGRRGELLDRVEQAHHVRRGLADPRRIADGRQVHEDVLRSTSRGGLTEQGGHVKIARRVHVAPPDERLRGSDELEAGLHGGEGDLCGAARRDPERLRPCGLLGLIVLWHLHGGREPRVRLRVLVGEVEEALREPPPRLYRAAVELEVVRVLRSVRERGDHGDQRCPE
jgi:hypothetical protein